MSRRQTKRGLRICIALLFSCLAARGADTTLERRLVPIAAFDAAGAYGTRWSTHLYGINDRDSIQVYGLNDVGIALPVPAGVIWNGALFYSNMADPPGQIVYVPAADSAAVHMTTILDRTDASGATDSSSIPVISETAFTAGTMNFVSMRRSVDERYNLRIYSLDLDRPSLNVRIQLLVHDARLGWIISSDTTVALSVRQQMSEWPPNVIVPVRPWATEISLDSLVDQADNNPTEFTVRVTPVTDGARIWGFVSETHNSSQRVQLVLPQ